MIFARSSPRALRTFIFDGFALYQFLQYTFIIILLKYFNSALQGDPGTLCILKPYIIVHLSRWQCWHKKKTIYDVKSHTPGLRTGQRQCNVFVKIFSVRHMHTWEKLQLSICQPISLLSCQPPPACSLYPMVQNREGLGKPLVPSLSFFIFHPLSIILKSEMSNRLSLTPLYDILSSVFTHQIVCPTQATYVLIAL